MSPVRIGAVQYLNTRPLVYGLAQRDPGFTVRFDVPSRCAALLEAGEVDLGLIPSIEFQRGEYDIVPGLAIASEGPVASVALFAARPIARVRTIALDTSSRTSAALVRVLCDEAFGIAPAFTPAPPDLRDMLRGADAALLIGDPALWTDHAALGLEKIDLGETWTRLTGLPFVWAFWAGRRDAGSPAVCDALTRSRDEGLAAVNEIAAEYAHGDPQRAAQVRAYLTTNIRYDLGEAHVRALERYYASAARLKLIDRARRPSFYLRTADAVSRA